MRAPAPVALWIVCAFAAPAAAGPRNGYTTLRVPYDHPHQRISPLSGSPSSRLVYLDGCWDGGCDLEPHDDGTGTPVEDSIRGYSSILDEPVTIPAFPHGRDRFEDVAACVRRIFGPFDIEITTEDPGGAPHWRHVMGGAPGDAGFADNILGVAPYDFEGCKPIPNAISYGFAELAGDDVTELCELAAHEIGHPLGLDHAHLCSDPMTYLPACGPKRFQDVDAPCGEQSERACECSETQNSHELLMSAFGERGGSPPVLEIASPEPGAAVSGDYAVEIAMDSDLPARIELVLNSRYTEIAESSELSYSPPADVSDGVHRYEIAATDQYGRRADETFSVVRGEACGSGGDCAGAEACVAGRCVPGPATDGGLGSACTGDADCLSGRCSIDPATEASESPSGVCVETCGGDRAAAGCPSGFACRADPNASERSADAEPVCLPTAGGMCAVAPPGRPGERAPLALWGALVCWMALRARRARGRAPSGWR